MVGFDLCGCGGVVYCCVYYIVVNSVVACGFARGMFCFGVIVLGLGIWLVIWVGAAWGVDCLVLLLVGRLLYVGFVMAACCVWIY